MRPGMLLSHLCPRAAIPAFAAAVLFVHVSTPAAAGIETEMRVGAGVLRGASTYRIGGAFATPEGSGVTNDTLSELDFPLDATVATLGFTVSAPTALGSLVFEGDFGRSLDGAGGTLRDSDWLEPGSPGLKTISSEAAASLEASLADVRLLWRFLERDGSAFGGSPDAGRASLAAGVGLLYRHLAFEASNARQLAAYQDFAGSVPGKVIEYESTWRAPYAALSAAVGFGTPAGWAVRLEARAGYSPLARVEDRDDHLQRAKLSEATDDGTAFVLGVRGRLTAGGRFFIEAGIARLDLDAEGTQVQTRYLENDEGPAGEIGRIEHVVTGRETLADLSIGLLF